MAKFRPSQLQFTQDSIKPYFENGNSIHEEIDRIKSMWSWSRNDAMQQFQPLEVAQDRYDFNWYCNNNRRLYMFRVLEKHGYVTEIKVSHIVLIKNEDVKFQKSSISTPLFFLF